MAMLTRTHRETADPASADHRRPACAAAAGRSKSRWSQVQIDAHLKALRQRYVDSPRYTLEADYREHAGQLKRDMEHAIA
jgi:hypothetical protein